MRICGMMRVKNEARWIRECVESLFPVCQRVYVLDDHSTDATFDILESTPNVRVYPSPFTDLEEARDKNYLLNFIRKDQWDWVVHIDGDEALFATDVPQLQRALNNAHAPALAFRVVYLWNDRQTIRTDGVYASIWRPSAFRLDGAGEFSSPHPHGFHCSNTPANFKGKSLHADVRLLHYGYMEKDDRLRKFDFYTRQDPQAKGNDGYLHIVQGDVPQVPASARLKLAGPLSLASLS